VPLGIGHALHGKYRLMRLLGDGGMGAVYEATHERLGTRVAIKVLHAEIASRPGIVDRFLQEARVSAQIRSGHVAQVMDVDRTPEGDAYMVMELLEGETLLALLERERKLSTGVACAFTLQILEALEAAHALGVVHRDLKPENVFVTHGTQKTVVKLIDFGIAKVRRIGVANLTLAGVTMGTAEYMSPEQAFSADRADARSDLYAVGVMFYEMLSGTRPVMGDDPRVIALKVERGEVKPLVHALPSVPPSLAGFAHRAMAARAEMRFQSAAEMRLALEKLVGHDAGGTLPLPLATSPRPATAARPSTPAAPQAPDRDRDGEEAHPRTAAPSTLRGTPVEHAAYGAPPLAPLDSDPPPPPGRTSALPLIALAVLLGVGAVVALAVVQQPHTPTVQSASVPSSPAAGSLAVISPVSTPIEEHASTGLRPLSKTPSTVVTSRPSVKADAGTVPTSTTPFPFPTKVALPIPSGGLQLPSAIPTELTLPGIP
jgi:serine/threonine-protein kinase